MAPANRWKHAAAACIAAFVLVSAYFAFFGPRVTEARGLGWDGQDYAPMVKDLSQAISSGKIATYRLVRFVPSAVVAASSRILGTAPLSDPQIANYYAFFNFLLICGSALVWRSIGRSYGFAPWVTWLGFLFGFFSYSMIRAAYFDPVIPDYFAIFLAMYSLKCYLEGRTGRLVVATIAAAFTWPVAFLVNGAMLIMPRQALAEGDRPVARSASASRMDRLARIGAVLVFVILTVYFAFIERVPLPYGEEQIVFRLVPLSLAISVAYVAWVARSASFLPFARRSIVSREGIALFVLSMVLYSEVRYYILSISGNDTALNSFLMMLRSVTGEPIVRPGQFLVEHVVFWGAWVLVYLAWLKRIFEASAHLPAIYFCVGLWAVFFLLGTGRYAVYFLPTIIFALCCALSARPEIFSRRNLVVLAAVSILGSRFWLPLEKAGQFDKLLEFPAQWYFMQLGGWMGAGGYLFNLVQLFLVAAALAVFSKEVLLPDHDRLRP